MNRNKKWNWIFAILAILAAAGLMLSYSQPEPTVQEIVAENPRYTFMIQCDLENVTLMAQTWNLEDNLEPKSGKNPRKYSVLCNLEDAANITPLSSDIPNTIPLPAADASHTFTVLEHAALTMVNMGDNELRMLYPVDSKGLMIFSLPMHKWVTDYKVTLYCWEESDTSSGNPEHVCSLW